MQITDEMTEARARIAALEAQLAVRTGEVKVKPLDENDYEEIINAAAINMRKAAGIRGQMITVQDGLDWWVMKETERRILSALEATPAPKGGRAVSVPPLPSSTVATWGPEDLGEQLSKWQDESVTEFEPIARPTRARPANARRKG